MICIAARCVVLPGLLFSMEFDVFFLSAFLFIVLQKTRLATDGNTGGPFIKSVSFLAFFFSFNCKQSLILIS